MMKKGSNKKIYDNIKVKGKFMLNKKIFFIISALILTYISNEIYIKLYEWNDPQNCFKKEYIETIGYAGECKGKLIVNEEILRALVNEEYKGKIIKNNGFLFKVITNYDDDNIFTGQVTDMSSLFLNKEVDYSIEDWNTSNVTNMRYMFAVNEFKNPAANSAMPGFEMERFTEKDLELVVTSELKENIGNWDVSKVIDMSSMFSGRQFNRPLNNWDVSKVTDMSYMFYDNKKFNRPLNNWNVSNVKNMSCMFVRTIEFNHPLNNWDVSKVTDMSGMLAAAESFNQPLNNWDVSKVKDMSAMFKGAIYFNQPLNNWDVSKVTDMSAIFYKAKNFNHPLNNWDVSNVNGMWGIFNQTKSFNQPLNKWKNKNLIKEDFKDSGIEEKNLPEFNDKK